MDFSVVFKIILIQNHVLILKSKIFVLFVLTTLFSACDRINEVREDAKREKQLEKERDGLRAFASVVGKVTVDKELQGFSLQRDTLVVFTDTLGFYVHDKFDSGKSSKKFRTVQNVEINQIYPNGKLLTTMKFGKARLNGEYLKITLHGSSDPTSFSQFINFDILDSNAIVNYKSPSYVNDNGQPFRRNDSLHIVLDKFPKKKGDIVRGKFGYKYLHIAKVDYRKELVKQYEHLEGCFEIIVD